MAEKVIINKSILTDIGNAIREKKGTTDLIPTIEMASEIAEIQSGGGLKGYSGTLANLDSGTIGEGFVAGLLEDGTLTTTFNTTSKYVVFVAFTNVGQFIHENVEYEAVYVYSNFRSFLFKPTADNWKVHWSGGGGAN